MSPPIPADAPAIVDGLAKFSTKFLQCFIAAVAKVKSLAHVGNIVQRSQLRNAGRQHHCKETDEEGSVVTELHKGCLAQVFKSIEKKGESVE